MQLPLQITFRDIPPSPAMEAKIREKAEKLDQIYDQVMSCRVVVEAGHRHHHQGNLYHVRIDLTVPDGELVVSREPNHNHAHEDAYVAIRDAFNAARRQLQNYAQRRRRDIKQHDTPPHGHVVEVNPGGYGRIATPDGREVYFHRNSVVDAEFDKLTVGAEVRYVEVAGERGPQASTVRLVGKHHIVG